MKVIINYRKTIEADTEHMTLEDDKNLTMVFADGHKISYISAWNDNTVEINLFSGLKVVKVEDKTGFHYQIEEYS